MSESRSPSPVYSPVRTVKKAPEKKIVSEEEPEVILIPGTPSPQRPEDVQDTAVSSTSEERESCEVDGDGAQPMATSPPVTPPESDVNDEKGHAVGSENLEENSSATSDSGATNSPRSDTRVSKDLLSKVRAMLKASRQATIDDKESSS